MKSRQGQTLLAHLGSSLERVCKIIMWCPNNLAMLQDRPEQSVNP